MKIGILGGGQLGRMLALAGIPLGHQFRFWEPAPDAPASDVGEVIAGEFSDLSLVDAFLSGLDCVTYEFENIPVELVAALSAKCRVYPSARSLDISQDRLSEKTAFKELGLGCAPFCQINSNADCQHQALNEITFPAILKTRRLGYDGKGQVSISSVGEVAEGWRSLGEAPAILEQRISFSGELSLICVRSRSNQVEFYPLVENRHRNGILESSRAPSSLVTPELQLQAEHFGTRLLEFLDHIGVLTIEFFLTETGLIVNEIAPRVHNSGHWTIEGCQTSQFENHIRAISGDTLGATTLRGVSIMLNLVGNNPEKQLLDGCSSAHLHLYRKASRPRRKVGHVTLNHAQSAIVEQEEILLSQKLVPFLEF